MILAGLALLIAPLTPPTAAAATEERKSCDGDICIYATRHDDFKIVLEASNHSSVPIGLKLEFEKLHNVLTDVKLPLEGMLPPHERVYLMKLVRQDMRQGVSFPFSWQASYGNPRAKHDDAFLYHMPFGGTEDRVLSQGANGAFTHKGAHAWSWDFAMPIGTPILAARSGKVVWVADGYTEAGTSDEFLPAANAITVLHRDGTFATYAHLDPGSGVREGSWVRTGELLGFSGNTGFSTGPHLHFAVWKGGYDESQTLPIRFQGGGGKAFVPKESLAYRPGCHAAGRACEPGELPDEPMPASYRPPVEKSPDGTCNCRNGSVITTHLPCRAVCP